ncbi:hypothetical protein Skr01_09710 [Sphaerisporangium krabiense]|nr:FAD/NAD(P)-binding protein [Sphaerisporangium krabiense]GII60886.1 hypothetical protein Skr01_09710 [Sphaerisporangium krabiense]
MTRAGRTRRVVIVGAGLAGTATAIRLLRFAREPLQVVLLERLPEYRGAGVAYHRAGNHWHHVFNIQAGRMSMFREDVDDFVLWANHEADRTDWPAEWRSTEFTESGPAPRRIYPDYLASRLAEAAREASPGVTLVEAGGEVVDLGVVGGHVRVVIEGLDGFPTSENVGGSGGTVLEADHVVLATGLERKRPAFAARVIDHPALVRHPYSEAGIARILDVRRDAVVAIVGTLLSAYDSAALLLRRGHTGTIHMISRSGLTLRTYPPDHRHQVLRLPPPRLHRDAYEGLQEFVRCLTEEWERACAAVAREYPDVPSEVITERVAKSWEPYMPEILRRVPSADLRALLDGYGSLLAVLRVGAVAYTTELVDAAMAAGGQIVLTTGRIADIRDAEAGRLALSVEGRSSTRTVEADLVILNFGRESDYERVDSALWANLLRKGLALPHGRTGRGVEVDERGVLLGPSGVPSGPISVVGGPREGDEIVRYGRTGAFAFNLAAIKNHSVQVAATVLHRLESCYDERADDVAALTGATEEAGLSIMLDVRRMASRRRADRQALEGRLEDSIQRIREITTRAGGTPATTPALRFAVNAAATVKMTDLSVTPRDLRSLLGLAEPAT